MAQPSATPVPIHDIAGAVWLFPYPVWVVILTVVGLALLIAVVVWLVRRARPVRPLTPQERALAALARLRSENPDSDSYAFGVQVSDALRGYIHDQHGLDAVTRTSVEFLESLRDNALFTANEKAALAEFLESVDLLKYARQSAQAEEIEKLLEIAERVVKGESTTTPPAVA